MTELTEFGTCSICGELYDHYGNNAQPINDGRCCYDCNAQQVVPARLALFYRVPKDADELMSKAERLDAALKRLRHLINEAEDILSELNGIAEERDHD